MIAPVKTPLVLVRLEDYPQDESARGWSEWGTNNLFIYAQGSKNPYWPFDQEHHWRLWKDLFAMTFEGGDGMLDGIEDAINLRSVGFNLDRSLITATYLVHIPDYAQGSALRIIDIPPAHEITSP